MDYYISRNPGTVFDSVACCGLGAGIEGIAELFSHELAQQVQILKILKVQTESGTANSFICMQQ